MSAITPRQIKAAQTALSFAREAKVEDGSNVRVFELAEAICATLDRHPDARLIRDAQNGTDKPYEVLAGFKAGRNSKGKLRRLGAGMKAVEAWRSVGQPIGGTFTVGNGKTRRTFRHDQQKQAQKWMNAKPKRQATLSPSHRRG